MKRRQIGYLLLLASVSLLVCVGITLVCLFYNGNRVVLNADHKIVGQWDWVRDPNIDPSLITVAQFDKKTNSYKQATIDLKELAKKFPKNRQPNFVEAVWMPCNQDVTLETEQGEITFPTHGCITLMPIGRWRWIEK